MSLIDVGEVQLDCERSGTGPPLLMIMGRSGTYAHWGEPFLEQLRRDFELILYDHRGVGASTRLEGPLTIRQMAEDAAGLIDALELDSVHVLGISMGSMIAQDLALARPQLIDTLTLGCSYCGGPGAVSTREQVMQRVAEALASGDHERAIRASWEANVSPALAADEQAWERFLEISLRRRVALEVIVAQTRACVEHDTHARLGQITLPTLLIHGTVDEVLPVENGHIIHELIAGSRLELFDDVGHLFFWERPQRSAELLRAHVAAYA
ncbi:MAG TPA: alpha/beta hydrolase [Solirubrobacteraceae bacterium]|jgi:3-oxoadipate enol-lactonase|nr:alpha/beta hydrolase [Solirubrobacteraceae bacterium]